MTTETIRYSKIVRYSMLGFLLLFLIAPGIFLWIVFRTANVLGSRFLESPLLWGILAPTFCILLLIFFLFVALAAYRVITLFYFRIDFGETSFRMRSFSFRGGKTEEHAYAEVVSVKRGLVRGEIILELAGSNRLRLYPLTYEGKEKRLLAELEKRLPPEKLEPGLGASLLRYGKYDKFVYPIMIGILVGVVIMNLQGAGVDYLRSKSGWTDAVPSNLGIFFKSLSVDEGGAVWFATTDVDNDAVGVGRLLDGSVRRWDVPAYAFAGDDNAYDILGVSGTAEGAPVIILKSYLSALRGGEWIRFPLPGEIYKYLGYSISDFSLQYLSSAQDGHSFWSCDLNQLACRQLPAPEAMKDTATHAIAYRGFPAGPVTVMGGAEGPISFFQYQNGDWSEIAAPLSIRERSFLAFTVSRDGSVWVTRKWESESADNRYTKGPIGFGRWNGAQSGWEWSTVPEFSGSFEQGVDYMEVDSRGRIWIAGHYRTDDVIIGETASVYLLQGEAAEEIVRYTDDNSNFQMGIGECGLVQDPEGRMWSCYRSLVNLDSGAEQLPAPIPDWLNRAGSFPYRMACMGIVIFMEIVYIGLMVLLIWIRKKSDRSAARP